MRYIQLCVHGSGSILGCELGPVLLPTASDPSNFGCPTGIRTRTSPPVRASVLPLDHGAVSKADCGAVPVPSKEPRNSPKSQPNSARPAHPWAPTLLVMSVTPHVAGALWVYSRQLQEETEVSAKIIS